MNDISGAIISCRYYRDGYYVSRGARACSSISLTLSIFFPLTFSLASPLSLSISLLLPLLSGNALTVAWKESGHCAARKQKPRLSARERGLVLSNIPISLRKGTMTKASFRQNFRARTRATSSRESRYTRHLMHENFISHHAVHTRARAHEIWICNYLFLFPFRRSSASEMYIGLRKKNTKDIYRYLVAKNFTYH